ncbi:MAG: hypothetical protein ACAH95_04710 [Fimbriimonas sp.]
MVLTLLLATATLTQSRFPEPLNPKTYASESGATTLWVNPNSARELGPAAYVLKKGGKEVWSKQLPFTLFDAGVSEAGIVGGYGYSASKTREGTLDIVMLNEDGSVRLMDKIERKPEKYIHGSPTPYAQGIIFDPDRDRFVVRLDEEWRWYGISSGKLVKAFNPKKLEPETTRTELEARAVPGTPYDLVSWWTFDTERGVKFTLIDENAKPVWKLVKHVIPPKEEQAKWAFEREFRKSGGILGTSKNRFQVWLPTENVDATYQVSAVGEVKEIGRVPHAKPVAPKASFRDVQLRLTGSFRIPTGKPQQFKSIENFQLLPKSRLAVLEDSPKPLIHILSRSGKTVRKLPIPVTLKAEYRHIRTTVAGKSLVVVASDNGRNAKSQAWRVDVDTGKLTPLKLEKVGTVDALAGYPDGSFAMLSTEQFEYTSSDILTRRNAAGKTLWMIETGGGYGGKPEEMLSPEDITIDSQGNVVVLDNIARKLMFFSHQGKFLKNIDFKKHWGADEPLYSTGVRSSGKGFVVLDFSAESALVSTDATGKKTATRHAVNAQGKALDRIQDLRVDESGVLWVCDFYGIYRLNSSGKVVATIGGTGTTGLTRIADVQVDPKGNVFALDANTAQVYAYDPAKKLTFIARPLPKDLTKTPPEVNRLELTRSGNLYVTDYPGFTYLLFSPTGQRLRKGESSNEKGGPPLAEGKPEWRWARSRLFDESGKVITTLERWPNLDWLGIGFDEMTQAPSGELLVYKLRDYNDPSVRGRIGVYTSGGQPIEGAVLPYGCEQMFYGAFDGPTCYFSAEPGVMAVSRKGEALWQFRPKQANDGWKVFVSKGGLALFDNRQTVYWYATP